MAQKHITILIKPASDLCQLSCTYCFYRELGASASSHTLMTKDTAQKLLDRVQAFGATNVQFAFQGGEPLLWGVENLTWFCQSVKERGMTASYALQTNGLAVNEAFCALFAEHHFLVGLSLDGGKTYHDKYRKNHNGDGSFDAVMSALGLLKKYHINHNILTVITQDSASHPTELYRHIKRLGVSDVQLIPCLPPMSNPEHPHPYTPTPTLYATFLKRFFNLWRDDFTSEGYPPFGVREFYQALSIMQNKPLFCGGRGMCTPQLVVESDGSFYPCDFYVTPSFKTGHVDTTPIQDTLLAEGMKNFVNTHPQAPPMCQKCPYHQACGGGCRRMRDVYLADNITCPLRALLDFIRIKEQQMP